MSSSSSSLLDGVEMAAEQLVHLKHVDAAALKHRVHLVVADNLSLVAGILKLVGLDVFPELFDHLRPGQL